MRSLIIEGPAKISGEVSVGGNKNAVLPMIAAALLADGETVLRNAPDITDVSSMLEIAAALGADVSREGDAIRIKTSALKTAEIPHKLCSALRTSILFAGPLLARTGKAVLWPPGGDVIGRRRLDAHFYGLRKLGAHIGSGCTPFEFKARRRLTGADLFLDEASVTATEHLLMTACLAKGTTIIRNAAAEPHVRQLAELLVKMGADISGVDTNTLTVNGVASLKGADHTVEGDHIEAASFLALAAATGGGAVVKGILPPRLFWMTRRVFERLGVEFKLEPDRITLPAGQRLRIRPDFDNAIPVISDGPWPQFPSDMMSGMIVAATQAKGTVMFFEKMFESRIYFVDRLIAMGANAIVCDPHRAVVSGKAKLRGIEMSSPDIRAGMAMAIAALCAKGKSTIHNADTIFRGYESFAEKIEALGGKISVQTR